MKQYTEPIVEILAFDAGDIIVTSPKGEDWTTPERKAPGKERSLPE